MSRRHWLSGALAVALGAGLAPDARAQSAQGQGFAIDGFDPSERGSDWFSVESLDLRGHLRPAVGVVMDGAYRPLVIATGDKVEESVVRNQIFGHVGASVVLWNDLRIGFNLPIAVFQDGNQGVIGGVTYAPPSTASVGDLRLGADLRLAGTYGDEFTLAVGTRVYVPSGQRDNYTGDGAIRLDGRLEAAGDLGVFTYAARIGAEYRNLSDTIAGNPLGSQLLFGAALGFRLIDHAFVFGPEVYGATIISNSDAVFGTGSTPVDALLGAHYTFLRDFRLGGGGGLGLTHGLGSPIARWMASIEWAPAIPKARPAPPAAPPEPPPDRDRDGVVDAQDACPDVPGVKTDDPKTNGCPPDPDRDKDGIANDADACPDVPGPANADPTKNGCPQAYITQGQIKIRDSVKFATSSASIVPGKDSEDVLQAVLKIFVDHPEIKVRIEGHTDNVAWPELNRVLSEHRAESVKTWLVNHGVDASRLTTQGFGPDRPIADNATYEGRRVNRRVEFHILDEGGEPEKR